MPIPQLLQLLQLQEEELNFTSSFFAKILFTVMCVGFAAAQSSYDLRSPNQKVELRVRTADRVRYDVLFNGRALLENCTLLLDIEHKKLGLQPKVLDAKERTNNQAIKPAVRQKFAQLQDNYNELRLTLDGGYAVVFRAYNEGVAYRLEIAEPAPASR